MFLIAAGCKVTAHDLRPAKSAAEPNVFNVEGDISDEQSISRSMAQAVEKFGPINILCANAGMSTFVSMAYGILEGLPRARLMLIRVSRF